MSTNCLESSRDCIVRRISKARASAWRRCNASCKSMAAECGQRQKWTRAQPSISPLEWENTRNRKVMEQRLEANYELRETRHTVGGGQSGRHRPCLARAATGETGQQHLRRARWRG